MKNIILLLIFITSCFLTNAQNLIPPAENKKVVKSHSDHSTHNHSKNDVPVVDATIDFESKVIDYGTIEHNSDGLRKFIFTNNGNDPLLIKGAKASCGCTVPDYPKDEIKPGEQGEIKVKYATNRVGKFTKTITLTTNASKKPVLLTIKGEVNPPPKKASVPEKTNGGAPLE